MAKQNQLNFNPMAWFRRNWIALVVLSVILAGGIALYCVAHPAAEAQNAQTGDYVEYENAVVREIISDSCEPDEISENHMRGEQKFTAEVLTGQYKGKLLLIENTVGPIYGQRFDVGDKVTISISTYSDGTIRSSVYEYDRSTAIYILTALFIVITVLVGGKVGAKSLVGLLLTVTALLWILLPLLLQGWATIPTTFLVCVMVACASFVILGGVNRKTICAMLGTFAGIALATLLGLLAQTVLRIDGYRQEYAEALLQLRQTGESAIGISGLVVSGVIISALGAVMDVAMSISSALNEIASVGEDLTARRLFKSGMNIGRDMVGTMTNTLILAIIGSGLTLIVYICSLDLPIHEFLSSPYLALELISGVASSCGVVLAVPLTALISAFAYGKKQN